MMRQRGNGGNTLLAASLLLLALGVCAPPEARAQWTCQEGVCYVSGNVGVGTASPAVRLQVSGTTLSGVGAGTPGDYSARSLIVTGRPLNDGIASIGLDANSTYRGALDFTGSTGRLQWWVNSGGGWVSPLTITGGGNVGIGTTAPGAKLVVTGGPDSNLQIGDRGLSGSVGLQMLGTGYRHAGVRFDGDNLIVENASDTVVPSTWYNGQPLNFIVRNGNVGIGTTLPAVKLQVSGTTLSGVGAGTPGDYSARSLIVTGRPLNDGIASIGLDANSTYRGALDFTGSSGNLAWYVNSGGNWSNTFTVTGGGKVGIGNPNPQKTLDVAGSINATGAITGNTIQATYQDVAEWVPSTQKLSAGTVVVLDSGRANHVLASTKPYDTAVAGVISDSPGVLLGEGDEGKLKVATTGRVKVLVDATRAAIKIGDLLVTGETPGVAMKSEPVDIGGRKMHAPGTILGKALEPLEKGVGEILVLLSLQ